MSFGISNLSSDYVVLLKPFKKLFIIQDMYICCKLKFPFKIEKSFEMKALKSKYD